MGMHDRVHSKKSEPREKGPCMAPALDPLNVGEFSPENNRCMPGSLASEPGISTTQNEAAFDWLSSIVCPWQACSASAATSPAQACMALKNVQAMAMAAGNGEVRLSVLRSVASSRQPFSTMRMPCDRHGLSVRSEQCRTGRREWVSSNKWRKA